jgi:hypothetical protein
MIFRFSVSASELQHTYSGFRPARSLFYFQELRFGAGAPQPTSKIIYFNLCDEDINFEMGQILKVEVSLLLLVPLWLVALQAVCQPPVFLVLNHS